MRAQLFEKTLKDIVEEINRNAVAETQPGNNGVRDSISRDRMVLAKIERMATKALER